MSCCNTCISHLKLSAAARFSWSEPNSSSTLRIRRSTIISARALTDNKRRMTPVPPVSHRCLMKRRDWLRPIFNHRPAFVFTPTVHRSAGKIHSASAVWPIQFTLSDRLDGQIHSVFAVSLVRFTPRSHCPPSSVLCPLHSFCPPSSVLCPLRSHCPPSSVLCPLRSFCPPSSVLCPLRSFCPPSTVQGLPRSFSEQLNGLLPDRRS